MPRRGWRWVRRRHVFGSRQELEFAVVLGGLGGLGGRRGGRRKLRRAGRLRDQSRRDSRDGGRRMRGPRGDWVVGAVVLPGHERALLAIGSYRLGREQLVERQRRADPRFIRAGTGERPGG